MNHPELEMKAPAKKKTRWPLYLLLLIFLGAAATACWAGWQYARTGEIVVPVPERFAQQVDELLEPDREGRLGPVRFEAEHFRGKLPSHTLGGELLRPRNPEVGDSSSGQVADVPVPRITLPGTEEADGTDARSPDQGAEDERTPLDADAGGDLAEPLPDQNLPQVLATPSTPDEGVQPPALETERGAGDLYLAPRDVADIPPAPALTDTRPETAPARQSQPPRDASPTVTATLSSGDEPKELVQVPQAPARRVTRPRVYSGEDSVVTLDFINDLAEYLVQNYWPAGSHPAARTQGVSTVGVKSANQRYGIDLKGFAGSNVGMRDYYRDRGLILHYVFMPSMIEALTGLYADRFADALVEAAGRPIVGSDGVERQLSRADTIEMLEYYAGYARSLGSAMLSYADNQEAPAVVNMLNRAETEAFAAHTRYLDAKLALEVAQEGGNLDRIAEAEKDAVRLERVYHLSRGKQKNAEDEVYQLMLKGNARNLDRSSLVYIAGWLNRRGPDNYYAVKAAANGTSFVAGVLEEKARELRGN